MKHNLPSHRKNAHNKPKGGKLSDHYVEADDEIVDNREILKIKAIADSTNTPDLGVQITTKGPNWLRKLRLYLENCQKPGWRSTEENKTNGGLYESFIQLRILAEEFYSGELENGLKCPVCLEPIDDLPSLRVFIEKKKENDFISVDATRVLHTIFVVDVSESYENTPTSMENAIVAEPKDNKLYIYICIIINYFIKILFFLALVQV